MGKGDKKSKRGKIILGTHGVRHLRKQSFKPDSKTSESNNDSKGPVKSAPEVREAKNNREKTSPKEVKAVKPVKEAKQKKDKTAE